MPFGSKFPIVLAVQPDKIYIHDQEGFAYIPPAGDIENVKLSSRSIIKRGIRIINERVKEIVPLDKIARYGLSIGPYPHLYDIVIPNIPENCATIICEKVEEREELFLIPFCEGVTRDLGNNTPIRSNLHVLLSTHECFFNSLNIDAVTYSRNNRLPAVAIQIDPELPFRPRTVSLMRIGYKRLAINGDNFEASILQRLQAGESYTNYELLPILTTYPLGRVVTSWLASEKNNFYLSREHALIEKDEEHLIIKDNGSTCGTFYRESLEAPLQRLETSIPQILSQGSLVVLGNIALSIQNISPSFPTESSEAIRAWIRNTLGIRVTDVKNGERDASFSIQEAVSTVRSYR